MKTEDHVTTWQRPPLNGRASQSRIDNIYLDNIIDVYGVWDTVDENWWITPKGKWTWAKRNHASNAVSSNPPEWLKLETLKKYPCFTDQKVPHRLVVRQIGRYVLEFKIS